MALAAVQTAMNHEGKTAHPFFSRPQTSNGTEPQPHTIDAPADHVHDDQDFVSNSPQSEKGLKKRTRKSEGTKHKKAASSDIKSQALMQGFIRAAKPQVQDIAVTVTGKENLLSTSSLEEDSNHERRKRQKTTSPEPSLIHAKTVEPFADIGEQNTISESVMKLQPPTELLTRERENGQMERAVDGCLPIHQTRADVPNSASTHAPGIVITTVDSVGGAAKVTTPKKTIKITKTGKLMSSPPKSGADPSSPPKKRRGRPPKAKIVMNTVTVIKYGAGLEEAAKGALAQKIEDILNQPKRASRRSTTVKPASEKPAGPPKTTHPFFNGKPNSKESASNKIPSNQPPPTPRKSAVTPGKLRAEAIRDRLLEAVPAFGTSTASSRPSKQSGLCEPVWPTRDIAHVRNLDTTQRTAGPELDLSGRTLRKPRKLKRNVVGLTRYEDVIERLSRSLRKVKDYHQYSDDAFAPPKDVRLPKRLLTNGLNIRERVCHHIPTHNQKEQRYAKHQHPAVTALLDKIEHSLTPFDEGRCEPQAWNQKYSPQCVSDVLQTGPEATELKNWLHSLTVLAVGRAPSAPSLLDAKKPPKKKRKKAADDFIVSDDDDDEEDQDMVELGANNHAASFKLPSIVRPRWTRNKNVVVMSGPHGCGKSAMIQAVAKELSFEVFEIHSGMRRSGKDIQDKIGDMTGNHLVNHKRSAVPPKEDVASADNTDNESVTKALQDDITSGRQGTMTSFFKINPASKMKAVTFNKQSRVTQEKGPSMTTSKQAVLPILAAAKTSQKQSLILFEEADVLFEEDQQFWIQVIKIAFNSKRPIIITCNDESRIPVLDLPLAAILRLCPPAVDLATDYLLALAGSEGHILERKAVSDLYRSKKHDLRGSITELQFWCQMSVGDRKGGLEWIYQRWPPGNDVDDQGRPFRVASEGTYHAGMGWVSHNVLESQSNPAFDKEEELLQEAWRDWGMDPISSVMCHPKGPSQGIQSTNVLDKLRCFDDLTESLSAMDIYCRVGLPTYDHEHDEPTDPTLPAITEKLRLSYTIAMPVLQVDHCSDYLDMGTSLYTQTNLLIRRAFPDISTWTSSSQTTTGTTVYDYTDSIVGHVERQSHPSEQLTRMDFAAGLDTLAAPPDYAGPERTFYNLAPSSFDRTFSIITLDLAPYVRTIVAHEQALDSQRVRTSSFLSAGGTGKRARTTRASRVALEGGARETKRRERWFESELNFQLVMRTAGKEWAGLGWRGEHDDEDGTASVSGSIDGTYDTDDEMQV